jgi:hypothetical protein
MRNQDQEERRLAARLRRIETLAILWSIPLLALVLIAYAVEFRFATFPVIATVANLIATILIIIITLVVLLRLIDTMIRFRPTREGPFMNDFIFLANLVLSLVLVGLLLLIIMDGGIVARSILFVFLALLLGWQNRLVLGRLRPNNNNHRNGGNNG